VAHFLYFPRRPSCNPMLSAYPFQSGRTYCTKLITKYYLITWDSDLRLTCWIIISMM
jgi:hypothetical protein